MARPLTIMTRRGFASLLGSVPAFLGYACGRASARQPAEKGSVIRDAAKSTDSKMLGVGASHMRSKGPIGAINMYLSGFHFYADDMGRQIEAHHFRAPPQRGVLSVRHLRSERCRPLTNQRPK
jgi:hypothetical protein